MPNSIRAVLPATRLSISFQNTPRIQLRRKTWISEFLMWRQIMVSKPNSESKADGLGEVSAKSFDTAPLMMTAEELAGTLCVSKRQVWRLKAKGDIPKPVNIGRSVRWRRSDILEWIAKGCPSSSSLINTLIYQMFWRPIYSVFLKP